MTAVTASAIGILTALLEVRTGQQLASYRAWRVETALKPLMRRYGLSRLDELVALLLGGAEPAIGGLIVDALVNGETSFFRDAAAFETVAAAVEAAERDGRRARIWSAGCSAGQEPLSVAMLFAERRAESALPIPEIVATDVSEGALVRARRGAFTQFEVQRGLPIGRLVRWFESNGADWIAAPELLGAIAFRRNNLVADAPPGGLFDVVLCRNVLLYLSAETRSAVFVRLAQAIRPGGTLILGAGETVVGQSGLFSPSARFRGAYERLGGDASAQVAA